MAAGWKKSGDVIRLATRGSKLALWQANRAADLIRAAQPGIRVELVTITTSADKKPDQPLHEFGDKGLFVKEIEEALLEGRADAGVHSMKDLPGVLPDGLTVGCVLEREDPRDALFSRDGKGLAGLPAGARIATSSLRRQGQIKHMRPDAVAVEVRGNVDTRLRKLKDGEFDAIVMALAGVKRLGIKQVPAQVFELDELLPAAAQGAIGLEIPVGSPFQHICQCVSELPARRAVDAEREFTKAIGADCKTPVACYCEIGGGMARLRALVCSRDGAKVLRFDQTTPESGLLALARSAAGHLLDQGAAKLF